MLMLTQFWWDGEPIEAAAEARTTSLDTLEWVQSQVISMLCVVNEPCNQAEPATGTACTIGDTCSSRPSRFASRGLLGPNPDLAPWPRNLKASIKPRMRVTVSDDADDGQRQAHFTTSLKIGMPSTFRSLNSAVRRSAKTAADSNRPS